MTSRINRCVAWAGAILWLSAAASAHASMPAQQTGAGELAPWRASELPLEVQDGDGPWKPVRWVMQSVPEESARYRAVLTPRRASLVQRDGDGTLRVLQQEIEGKDTRLVYDDPILWLPADMRPGQTWVERGRVRQTTLAGKPKRQGTYVQRMRLVGQVDLQLDGRPVSAWRVQQTTEVTMGWVELVIEASTDYVQGVGLVRQEMTTTSRAYAVFGGRSVERLRPPPPSP